MSKQFEEIRWEKGIEVFVEKFQEFNKRDILGLVGEFESLQSVVSFKDFMNQLDINDFAFCNFPIKSKEK